MTENNIFAALKLAINELLSESVPINVEFDIENCKTMRLINILEHYFYYGLKSIRNLIYSIREVLSKYEEGSSAFEIIQNLSNLNTPFAQFRAFIMISLLKKQLSFFYQILISSGKISHPSLYESYACLMTQEAELLDVIMQSLSCVDFTLAINEMDLNYKLKPIDYSYFMNIYNSGINPANLVLSDSEDSSRKIMNILSQKDYLEDRIKTLELEALKLKETIKISSIRLEKCSKKEETIRKIVAASELDMIDFVVQRKTIIETFKNIIANETAYSNEQITKFHRQLVACQKELKESRAQNSIMENDKNTAEEALKNQTNVIIRQGGQIMELKNEVISTANEIESLKADLIERNKTIEV